MRTRRREPRKAVELLAHYDGELDDKRREDEIGNCHRVSHPLARSLEDLLAGGASRGRIAALGHGAIQPHAPRRCRPLDQTGRRSWTGTI